MKKIVILLKDIISFVIYLFLCIVSSERQGKAVLLYHSIGYTEPENDPYRLNMLPEVFDRHLEFISRHRDRIEITFDDGYKNNFEHALPLLKKYNLSATIFLITDFIDGKILSMDLAGERFDVPSLTWGEARAMNEAGIKFGSHSKTHAILTKMTKKEVENEVTESKKRIEEILGCRIERFSYPFGHRGSFNGLTREALINAGFNYAYTNIMGINSNSPEESFILRRIRIYREDGLFKLKMKIKGAYDWTDSLNS